jgi:hypothetical protein
MSADESHLVQDHVNVFAVLIQQLTVKQGAVLGSIAALVNSQVFGAFCHQIHLLSLFVQYLGMPIRAFEFTKESGHHWAENFPNGLKGRAD